MPGLSRLPRVGPTPYGPPYHCEWQIDRIERATALAEIPIVRLMRPRRILPVGQARLCRC